jgi:hypothetical protein
MMRMLNVCMNRLKRLLHKDSIAFNYLHSYFQVFPKLERVYNRDEFLFAIFLLFLVACAYTIRPTADKILNR